MRIAFVVHGFVQGVGYRYFVKRTADALDVKGMARNQDDGSVLVIAESSSEVLEKFEAAINVSAEHGVDVQHIEKIAESDSAFPKISYDNSKFSIKK